MLTEEGANWSPVSIRIVVVEPVPVHAEAVVAGGLGLEVDAFGAGFLLVGAGELVPALVAVAVAAIFAVAAGLKVACVECDAATVGAEEVPESGGDCDCWTSTFDEPLLQPATVSIKVSPAAIVPAVRMPVTTSGGAGWFSPASWSAFAGRDHPADLALRRAGEVGNRVRLGALCAS